MIVELSLLEMIQFIIELVLCEFVVDNKLELCNSLTDLYVQNYIASLFFQSILQGKQLESTPFNLFFKLAATAVECVNTRKDAPSAKQIVNSKLNVFLERGINGVEAFLILLKLLISIVVDAKIGIYVESNFCSMID